MIVLRHLLNLPASFSINSITAATNCPAQASTLSLSVGATEKGWSVFYGLCSAPLQHHSVFVVFSLLSTTLSPTSSKQSTEPPGCCYLELPEPAALPPHAFPE